MAAVDAKRNISMVRWGSKINYSIEHSKYITASTCFLASPLKHEIFKNYVLMDHVPMYTRREKFTTTENGAFFSRMETGDR